MVNWSRDATCRSQHTPLNLLYVHTQYTVSLSSNSVSFAHSDRGQTFLTVRVHLGSSHLGSSRPCNTDPYLNSIAGRKIVINVEYNQLDPMLRSSGYADGDVNDPKTGFSPYPGNINQVSRFSPTIATGSKATLRFRRRCE
jgi:hypothetical protein